MPAQGSSVARTLGSSPKSESTLKGFATRGTLSGLFPIFISVDPGLSLALQPWAGISERLRRWGTANAFGVGGQLTPSALGDGERLRRWVISPQPKGRPKISEPTK